MTTTVPTGLDRPTGLETGWQRATPLGDTVQRHGLLAMAAAWAATAEAGRGRIHRAEGWEAVDLGRPTGLFNSATLTRPHLDADLDDALDRIERFYDHRGTGSVLLWSPSPTPDLTGRGWTLQGHPPLLYRPAGSVVQRRRRAGLDLEEVASTAGLASWCDLAVAAFPLTEVARPAQLLTPEVLSDERFRFVLARLDGRAVGVGSQVVVAGVNVLLLSAVDPMARGLGVYGALVADRLARTPDLPSVTVVSDDSRPILTTRFGFLPVSRWTLWERARP